MRCICVTLLDKGTAAEQSNYGRVDLCLSVCVLCGMHACASRLGMQVWIWMWVAIVMLHVCVCVCVVCVLCGMHACASRLGMQVWMWVAIVMLHVCVYCVACMPVRVG